MEGRASGSPGAERAARHLAAEFQRLGLRPGGDGGAWLQAFTVPTGIRLGDVNALTCWRRRRARWRWGGTSPRCRCRPRAARRPSSSSPATASRRPSLNWDDYAGLDVRGRIVLVLEREPRRAGSRRAIPAAGRVPLLRAQPQAHQRARARRARLLLVAVGAREPLPPLTGHAQSTGILAAAVTPAVADALLAPAGVGLAAAAAAIEAPARRRARSRVPGARVAVQVSLVRERGRTANVVGDPARP